MAVDRLLQNFRIVSKVLIFVVPLIIIISGLGTLGHVTASRLDHQMELSKQTIENLSDFQSLRAALSRFTSDPTEPTHKDLLESLEKQGRGINKLYLVIPPGADRDQMLEVNMLSDRLRQSLENSWNAELAIQQNISAIEASQTKMLSDSKIARDQLDTIGQGVKKKQDFIKQLMLDASAFQALSEKLFKLKELFKDGADAVATASDLKLHLPRLREVCASGLAIVSPEAQAPIKTVVGKINQMAQAVADLNASSYEVLASDISQLQEMAKVMGDNAAGNTQKAAGRFAGIDRDVRELSSLSEVVITTFKALDESRIHIANLRNKRDANSLAVVRADLQGINANAEKLVVAGSKYGSLRELQKTIGPSIATVVKSAEMLVTAAKEKSDQNALMREMVASASTKLESFVGKTQMVASHESSRSAQVSLYAAVGGLLLALVGGAMLVETLRGPLNSITEIMTRLANGDLDVRIDGRQRRDEIGNMFRSVAVFRDNARARIRLESEAEETRIKEFDAGTKLTAERQRVEAEQREALNVLSEMLGKLADGNLQERMCENLAEDYVGMAKMFNSAIDALRTTLLDVRHATSEISNGTTNLAAAADDLAHRTEQQSFALENSALALAQLTHMVKTSATNASETAIFVKEANAYASHSSQVVSKAIDAMGQITDSSKKIGSIVSVIDEIAFQTNLLALNAGVEASRAGEAGRGFAVVAQEVRQLASRCTSAAREIKGLITESSAQVHSGVALVRETGDALGIIHSHIGSINMLVETISGSANEQSRQISGINDAVGGVEKITQANAAMVEENTAEIHSLRSQVSNLGMKISQFRIGVTEAEGNSEAFAA